jgi:hypothetical protein
MEELIQFVLMRAAYRVEFIFIGSLQEIQSLQIKCC